MAAAEFTLEDLQGRPVSSDTLKGKRVLLNFWATWCPASLTEFPVLNALQQRHPHDLVVLGVSLDSPNGTEPPTGPLDCRALRELRKTVGSVAARHRIGFPVLLDPERRIGRRFVGGRSLDVWDALLRDADRPNASGPGGPESGKTVGGGPVR